jgi:hypothetical protein
MEALESATLVGETLYIHAVISSLLWLHYCSTEFTIRMLHFDQTFIPFLSLLGHKAIGFTSRDCVPHGTAISIQIKRVNKTSLMC